MLKQRVLTALVLLPLAIWGIYALSDNGFKAVMAVITLLAALEWSKLSGLKSMALRITYVVAIFLLLAVINHFLSDRNFVVLWLAVVSAWWLLSLFRLLSYRQRKVEKLIQIVPSLLAGVPVLTGMFLSIVLIRQEFGSTSIFILMLLVWGADTGAYFTGRKFGKHKLLPNVSPGKTLEGVWGALITGLLIAAIVSYAHKADMLALAGFLLTSLLTVVFSIIGDLSESLAKRRSGFKDSGHILPGHGGILDRIDSLTAAAPVFYLGITLF